MPTPFRRVKRAAHNLRLASAFGAVTRVADDVMIIADAMVVLRRHVEN